MTNAFGTFQVSTNIYIPPADDQMRVRVTEYFRDHAEAINRREVSTYDTQQSPTGQQWPAAAGNNIQRRRVPLRSIVPITINSTGAPNINTFAHGLNPKGYIFTKILTVIGNGVDSWVPLPTPGTNETTVEVTETNVVIGNTTNAYNGFTGYCVLEYITA